MSDCFVLYLLLTCMKKKTSGADKFTNNKKYEPKTSMENLITNIFLHYDCEIEEESSSYNEGTYIEAVQAYVTDTGLSEFDYEV